MGEQLDEEQLEQLWQLSASQAVGRRRAQRSAGNTLMTTSQGKAVRGGKKQYSLSILQIPPLHMIWITSHVTVDVLTQALNLIAMTPLAMRSFFSVAVYQLACCLIPPSHILYHPPYVDLPQICKREI